MLDERSLVRGVREGDPAALRQLVADNQRLIHHMIARVVEDADAREDLCQEVLIKVYQNIGKFRFGSSLGTWIARIAYLTAVNEAKRRDRGPDIHYPEELSTLELPDPDAEAQLWVRERNAYLALLIRELPLNYQTVLELYYREGYSLAEISQVTGLPEGTIKTYLFRARQMLKERLRRMDKK